jgi:uncharacterized membrane protein
MRKADPKVDPQLLFARNLRVASVVTMILITSSFLLYILSPLPQRVPLETVLQNWHLSSTEFSRKLGLEPGWDWIRHLGNSDMICFGSIALMALGTPVSLAVMTIAFFSQGNRYYGVIAILQLLVLCFAASGLAALLS